MQNTILLHINGGTREVFEVAYVGNSRDLEDSIDVSTQRA